MTSHVDQVVLWMATGGLSGEALIQACIERLGVKRRKALGLVAEAKRRVTLAAEYNRDELLGTALVRLNDLYARCMQAASDGSISPTVALAKALAVQQEINRLTGLHAGKAAGAKSEGAGAELREELDAVAAYLVPLGLAEPDYPVREHARLAAQRIRELEAVAGKHEAAEPSGER